MCYVGEKTFQKLILWAGSWCSIAPLNDLGTSGVMTITIPIQLLQQCRRIVSRSVLLIAPLALSACGGGGGSGPMMTPPPPMTYTAKSGVAEKGPLIKGSTVTAQQLDANLSPTGQQFSYQTTSDLGEFSPTSTFTSRYIGVVPAGITSMRSPMTSRLARSP